MLKKILSFSLYYCIISKRRDIMILLAVNSGSSTLKFRLYNKPREKDITKGELAERI